MILIVFFFIIYSHNSHKKWGITNKWRKRKRAQEKGQKILNYVDTKRKIKIQRNVTQYM